MPDLIAPDPKQPFKVFINVILPVELETDAVDAQSAWDIMTTPGSRAEILKRLVSCGLDQLLAMMELQGFAEPLQPETKGQA